MWPAPSTTASVWGPALTARGSYAHSVSRPAPPRKPKPKPREALIGCACRVGVWHNPECHDEYDHWIKIAGGAFNRLLDEIDEGKRNVNLFINHIKDKPYACTRDGSLKLFLRGSGLFFRVLPITARAREVIDLARRRNLCEASIGQLMKMKGALQDKEAKIIVQTVKDVDLHEISLVDKGACPDTFVRHVPFEG